MPTQVKEKYKNQKKVKKMTNRKKEVFSSNGKDDNSLAGKTMSAIEKRKRYLQGL